MSNQYEFANELARIIEKLCDGDRAALDQFYLRNAVTLEHAIGAALLIAPKTTKAAQQ